MSLESAQYINQLNQLNPDGTDFVSTADDHLRLIKSTLKNTFPNITGPVNLSQSELNSNQFLVDTGTTNNIVVNPTSAWTSYTSGKGFTVKILNNTTSISPTINVSGLGVQNIVTSDGLPVVLYSNSIYDFVHNGTSFVLKNMYVKKAYTDEVLYNPVLNTYTSLKSTGELRLGSSSTDIVTINTSGNIGIGNTAPAYGFDITKTSMALVSGTNAVSFALGSQSNVGAITADSFGIKINCSSAGNSIEVGKPASSSITLSTASTARLKIKADGSINIGSVFATDTAKVGISSAENPTGYATLLELKNESVGVVAPSKFVRITPTGTLEIRNNANTTSLVTISDAGVLTPSGGMPAGSLTAGTLQDGMLSVQQSINDSSYKLATTNWVNRNSSVTNSTTGPNWYTLPSGHIILWGSVTVNKNTKQTFTLSVISSYLAGKTVISITSCAKSSDITTVVAALKSDCDATSFSISNPDNTYNQLAWYQVVLV